MADCVLFAATVLTITSIWVYVGRKWYFSFLANAMYFPTLISLFFVDDLYTFATTISGVNEIWKSVFYSCVAVVSVYVIVYGCLALDVSMSWATKVEQASTAGGVHEHNSALIMGFLRAAGEEIGWRCFLLPCLLTIYSQFTALLISGIVWGLFHVPIMILLTYMLKVPKPNLTILVQSVSCMLMAFPIGWLAIKSKYSLWACSIMHCVWNQVNPSVLGSIYTQTPGKYEGVQWKINGEGLAGCIVLFPVAVLCLFDLIYN